MELVFLGSFCGARHLEQSGCMMDWCTIKGILFDKDGTLVKLNPMWLPAWTDAAVRLADAAGRSDLANELLRQAGYDRISGALESNAVLLSGTVQNIIGLWKAVLGEDAPANLEAMLWKVYAGTSTRDPVPTTDLKTLFRWFRRQGYVLGIATNDSTRGVKHMIEHLDIAHDLSFACGSDAGHGGKPGPGMALAFCEQTGVAPHHTAMVGDSIADVLMARAAGFGAVIGVRTGGAMTRDLERNFDLVVGSVEDLPKLVKRRAHDS